MNLSEIAQYRLSSQQIGGTNLKSAPELVQWMGAMQAQEYTPAKWSFGLRLAHLLDSDIEKDFAAGKILRTHLLRPTWHFVSANDIRWLLMLTAPRVHAVNAPMYRRVELDEKTFHRTNELLTKILAGGKQHTRNAISEEFKKYKIEAQGHRLSYIMMYAELSGIVCSGARQGNQFTYALLDERITFTKILNKEEALAELAKRYFLSRGPATIKDFSTWSGLTLRDCRMGLEMTKSNFDKKTVDDQEYYFSTEMSFNKKTDQSIYLLPTYDEFIMGYKDRSSIFEFKKNLKTNLPHHYNSMIIFNGQVIGTWKRNMAKKSIELQVEFFKPLNKTQSTAFKDAVHRLENFSSMSVQFEMNK